MANAYAFDTLGYARALEEAGVERRQSEAHATAARSFILAEVATKRDIDSLRTELNQKIENSRLTTIIAIGGFNAALLAAASVIFKMMSQ
ncbi:hypothetical protein [Enterovirga rhinocerotis]|uniref:DUF1640 domain-containing protein n=1 Tax=Enterovirga rhinocerotis TaxID=1339210 RepID=A0A4R7BYW4_9HYPH|nr:hypothetical protein [Enterovirga rhinocerotis]TDR89246.1 hypothetical protein EV668_3736 [Enterovirga rhinocerotis]